MILSKSRSLGPLLQSRQGQHLTIYVTNERNIFQLKTQLREALDQAYAVLASVMSPDALVRFLAPIHNFIDDTKMLKSLKGNIGVFRNEGAFRILSLPVAVENTCIVATSFHVKPLLRWIQEDQEFLLLGLTSSRASLYHGSQSTFQLVDTIVYPTVLGRFPNADFKNGAAFNDAGSSDFRNSLSWINEWITRVTEQVKPPMYIAGESHLTAAFLKAPHYPNTSRLPIWPMFSEDEVPEICTEVRRQLLKDSKQNVEQSLMEFYQAEEMNLASKNLFQIAKAVLKGKVRKLIIADGISIFGKVDRKSGGVAIHPTHLDHEDDDILDDLAQEVLARGGEVVVAAREDIPKGRPILAIFERAERFVSRSRFMKRPHDSVVLEGAQK